MVAFAAFDRVVAQIYEAALVPARWEIALTQMIAEFAPRDWEVAFLLWERHTPPMGRFLGTVGVEPIVEKIYLDKFAGRNEWSDRSRRVEVGHAVHSDQLISRNRFKTCSLYQDFLCHWNFGVALIAMLDRQGPDQLGLVLPGPLTHGPGELAEVLPLLMPHFQRAARISRRISEADFRASSATRILDTSPYAVFALAPGMKLTFANRVGQDILAQGGVLQVRAGSLVMRDRTGQAKLAAMCSGQDSDRSYTISVPDEATGQQHIFTALSISEAFSGELENSVNGSSLALIGGQHIGVTGEMEAQIEQAFGLTPAEARLASHICAGTGLAGYARDRSVSMNAARFLLRGIYEKTGVNSHVALSAWLRNSPLGWGQHSEQKPQLSSR